MTRPVSTARWHYVDDLLRDEILQDIATLRVKLGQREDAIEVGLGVVSERG